MFSRLLALSLVLLLAGNTRGQAVDGKKIRDLVQFPAISLTFGIGFNPERGFILFGDTPDVPAEITAIEQELRGNASDAYRYCRLSYLYKDAEKSRRAAAVAVTLARIQPQLDPSNGRSVMVLGEALIADKQEIEGERMLRRAVELAPRDADCWLSLASFLEERSWRALLGKNEKVSPADVRLLFTGAWPQPPTDANVALRKKLGEEARRCYDWAVAVAPDQAKPYSSRALSRSLGGAIDSFVRVARREEDPAAPGKQMITPEVLADLQKAADLSPDNARAIGVAGFYTIMAALSQAQQEKSGTDQQLKDRIRKMVDGITARLAPLTTRQDVAAAADACYLSALFEYLVYQDRARAEKRLRQAVALQPRHDQSWDFLVVVLGGADENVKAVAAACEERLRHKDTPRNRYFAARTNVELAQFDQAQRHLEASLRNDPDDMLTNVSLAALLLKRADQPDILNHAGIQLRTVEALLFKNSISEFAADAHLLRGAYAALTADTDAARQILRSLAKSRNSEHAARILRLIGD